MRQRGAPLTLSVYVS